MTIYVAEVLGRGIAAFQAADDGAAEAFLASTEFRRHLIVLRSQGRALWDGVSPIRMRQASPAQAEAWRSGPKISDEGRLVFLIPVVDPSQDTFDNDDDDDHDHDDDRD